MKPKKTVLENFTTRYHLVIRNEENLAEKPAIGFTPMKLIVLGFAFTCATFIFCFLLSKTILALWFDPNHARMESKKELQKLTYVVDSLAQETEKKERFIQNIQRIIMGDTISKGIELVSVKKNEPLTARNKKGEIATPNDSAFRREYEASTLSQEAPPISRKNLDEIAFFCPVSGIITSSFNEQQGHFGIDIVTKTNEPVKAVADGTVALASWTHDGGYVIIIQHKSNLLSLYKHNAELAKKVGNFVNAGDIISIVGNTGELTDGPHLHFEMWHDGEALNPEDFVNFR